MRLAKRCACAARAASPSSVGAAYSERPSSAAAPTACSRSLRSTVVARTASSRTRASGSPTGERHEHRRDAVAELHALAVVAHRHRAEHLERRGRRCSSPCASSNRPTRAADPGEHHVVHRAPERLAHLSAPVSSGTRTVSMRRPRPTGPLSDSVGATGSAADQRADRASQAGGAVDDLAGASAARAHACSASSAGRRDPVAARCRPRAAPGRAPAPAAHPSGVEHRRLAREVEEHGRDVDARDAVGERVVRLVDQPDVLAAVDALDEPELPQRVVAVEHLVHEPLGELEQLAAGAGRGQRGEAHVVARCRTRGRRPRSGARAERHRHHPLAEARDELQARRRRGRARRRAGSGRRARRTARARAPRPRPTCMGVSGRSRCRKLSSSAVSRS